MRKKVSKKIRVGFDLDGVLLYNPARLARPLIKFYKKKFLGKKRVSFYVPKSPLQTLMWDVLHKSSLWITPGIDDIYKLVDEDKIEAYIMTARFEHLKKNTQKWIDKLNYNNHFKKWYYNKDAKQPHLYKEELIKKHNLDIFIDDNWDIVSHLSRKLEGRTEVYWIYNLLDRSKEYPDKFSSVQKAVDYISRKFV